MQERSNVVKLGADEEVIEPTGTGNVELDPMEILLDVPARQNMEDSITLKRPGGKTMKFVYRPIAGEEYKKIQEQCTTRIRDRRAGGFRTEFDNRKSQRMVVQLCVKNPDLNDPRLLKTWGVAPEVADEVLDKALLPGEVDALAESILELSGYTEEVLEKVKV